MTDSNVTYNVETVLEPTEIEFAKRRLTEIRFECLVKMYDIGYASKTHLPQLFKQQINLTLEFIQQSEDSIIGRAVKDGYLKIMEHIKQYENKP